MRVNLSPNNNVSKCCEHSKNSRCRSQTGIKTKSNKFLASTLIVLWLLVFVLAVCVVTLLSKNNNKINLQLSEATNGAWATETVGGITYNLIADQKDMETLATNVASGTTYAGEYFKLSQDVTLDRSWKGIGKSDELCFKGLFDGNKHSFTFDNLYYYAVFEYVGAGATICNINTNGSASYLGSSIVSRAIGTASNPVTIEKCKNEASFDESISSGIIGIAEYATIKQCVNLGTITGGAEGGGNAAGVVYSASNTTIQDCYNLGKIEQVDYGGPHGTEDVGAGGIVHTAESGVKICRCYNAGVITAVDRKDSIILNKANDTVIENCYYLSSGTSSSYCTGLTEAQLKAGNFDSSWDFKRVWFADGENYPVLRAIEGVVDLYTFTLVHNDGTGATTVHTLECGDTRILAVLTHEGYIFNGWDITADAGTIKSTITKSGSNYVLTAGDGNATITAQWTAIMMKITLSCTSLAGEDYMAYIYRGDNIIRQIYLTLGQTTIELPYVENYASNQYKVCFVFGYCGTINFTTLTNATVSEKGGRNVTITNFNESTKTATLVYGISNPRVNTTVII